MRSIRALRKRPSPSPCPCSAAQLQRESGVWALCLFATLLFVATMSTDGRSSAPPPPRCDAPRELAAARGWTRVVTCAPRPGGGRPLRGPVRWLFGHRVDLNAADAQLLEALPGVGPARARDIVDERRRRPFATIDALARVHGIGRRTVERLRPFVRVDPPRAPAPASAIDDGEG